MNLYVVLVLLVIFFAVLPLIFLFSFKQEKHIKIAFSILLILYVVILCVGVFWDVKIKNGVISISSVIVPEDAQKHFNCSFLANRKSDFFINILMFIPFGFLLGSLFNKQRVLKTSSIGLIATIMIEFVQYFMPSVRSAQLSDIILNFLSCLIGAVGFSLFYLLRNKIKKSNKNTHT